MFRRSGSRIQSTNFSALGDLGDKYMGQEN